MKLDIQQEVENRVLFIRRILEKSGATGIVYGNSGGKDCTLVGILCKMATDTVLSVVLPIESKQNFGSDREHAFLAAAQYNIETIEIDLTAVKAQMQAVLGEQCTKPIGLANINPRLRMTALYAIGQERGYLVAGTGNRSERAIGYFTKFGDGACDFNPIADLTVGEVYAFLEFLKAPREIIDKAPSAGLWDGQTDEAEMGMRYADIDNYLLTGEGDPDVAAKIERSIRVSAHKRALPPLYGDDLG